MNNAHSAHAATLIDAVVVETTLNFSLIELCHACGSGHAMLVELVDEGVLEPRAGSGPDSWVFDGSVLRTARTATRLIDALRLSAGAAALVLDLLAQIDTLQARLRHSTRSPA